MQVVRCGTSHTDYSKRWDQYREDQSQGHSDMERLDKQGCREIQGRGRVCFSTMDPSKARNTT